MNCDDISKLIPLYYYGELSPDEEELVDGHTHQCAACASRVEQQRTVAAALDRRAMDLPHCLLEDCRADLMAAVQGGAPRERVLKGPWTLFLEALAHTLGNLNRVRQPVGAVALIAIGFFGARLCSTIPGFASGANLGSVFTPGEDIYSTVRSVQPDDSGSVVISYDETRRRMLKGSMNDPNVQRLLVAGAHEDNPAVRGESVSLLKNQSHSSEVRDTLIELAQDPNIYVQLKAMEGLKPLAADPQVRQVLVRVLRADNNNAAVKSQAIDILTAHRDDTIVGLMQALVQHEQSQTVRLKLEKALREMNASIGTF
jgi:hypothetical protein